jgi:hypothetical protein
LSMPWTVWGSYKIWPEEAAASPMERVAEGSYGVPMGDA